MEYISTRGSTEKFSASQAILKGIASDGGLLVPEHIPEISLDEITRLAGRSYADRAEAILSLYLTDYTPAELRDYIAQAYSEDRFGINPAPLVQLNKYNDREFILELWHGPTAAFKDVALQLMPFLLTAAIQKAGETAKVCILTATSGDTGKAALEGFRDVEGTSVVVFFPAQGVSEAQKLQMITQEGDNCHVFAVEGSFDDTQAGVKAIFSDQGLAVRLREAGILLTSANSINWGRLVPQIVYYFSAYADLLQLQKIEPGEKINLVVPTGNFGNILAAWYARRMGLPVGKLICASNRNKVLSDFIRNGQYDRRREFFRTSSPSMDILVSSNLERLLFELSSRNCAKVSGWMAELQASGFYQVDPGTLRNMQEVFVGGFCDEPGTLKTIHEVYDRCDHLIDPHTAVGFNVYSRYAARSADETKTIFISTASLFKFSVSVGDALYGIGFSRGRSEQSLLELLSRESGLEVPVSLNNLQARKILHQQVIGKSSMKQSLEDLLLG
jgi:threonine synthase